MKITLESSNNHLVPIFIATKEKQSAQPSANVFINTKVKNKLIKRKLYGLGRGGKGKKKDDGRVRGRLESLPP
jgi:hypothetical protein